MSSISFGTRLASPERVNDIETPKLKRLVIVSSDVDLRVLDPFHKVRILTPAAFLDWSGVAATEKS